MVQVFGKHHLLTSSAYAGCTLHNLTTELTQLCYTIASCVLLFEQHWLMMSAWLVTVCKETGALKPNAATQWPRGHTLLKTVGTGNMNNRLHRCKGKAVKQWQA